MLLSLREELRCRTQFIKCQRRYQCVKVPHLACQRLHLQRLLFSLSEDGLHYHTVVIIFIVIISGCRSLLGRPLLLLHHLVTIHKHILQGQESKEQDRWETADCCSSSLLSCWRLKVLELDSERPVCSYLNEVVIMKNLIGSDVSLQVSWCLCLTHVYATASEPWPP